MKEEKKAMGPIDTIAHACREGIGDKALLHPKITLLFLLFPQ